MKDWTEDERGRANNSPLYLTIVGEVVAAIRSLRVGDDPTGTARRIVAQMAHVHGLTAPRAMGEIGRGDDAGADEGKPAQSTEGRSPSSDLEILGHNSTGGGEGVENVSSAEHLRGAPPITGQGLPTPESQLQPYDPQRHARIVWDNIHHFTARPFGGSPARAVTTDERRVEAYATEEIATMLTRAYAIGFEAGRARIGLGSASATERIAELAASTRPEEIGSDRATGEKIYRPHPALCFHAKVGRECTRYLSGAEGERDEIHNVLDKIDPRWALDRAKDPRARVLYLVTSIRNVMASYREAIAVVEDLHKLADRAHSISNFAKVSGP